MIGYFYKLYW